MSKKSRLNAGKKPGDIKSKIEAGPKKVPASKKVLKGTTTNRDVRWEFIHTIAFWGLAVLIFIPPYFRGLFFAPEQERALIFGAVIFWIAWLWKWLKRDYSFLSHPLDYCVLAFPAVYLISAFQAANYGLAVDEVVKTTLYFLVYWLASRLVRNEMHITKLMQIVYISAVGVALAGLATATGIIYINDGFLNGRIYSTFQYPNALASYLAAVLFIGLYLWHRAGGLSHLGGAGSTMARKGVPAWMDLKNFVQYLYAAGNFILLTVLLGTKSQGGLLVFIIMAVIFIIGLPRGSRITSIFHFVLTGIASLVAVWQFLSAVAGSNMGLAWMWIFTGLVLVLAGQALYGFGEKKGVFQWLATRRKLVLTAVLLVMICGCIGAGVYVNDHGGSIKDLAEEIRVRNAAERAYFFQDALKMFQERPLLGWGGGGWQEAYRAYQGYLYNSNQVHGHYFQIMVETGILGLLAILGIWVSFMYLAHRLYHGARGNDATRFLVWTITVAAISIGLHAVIDFDLSLSALALVLWTMFGFARGIGIYTGTGPEEKKSKKYVLPDNIVLITVSVISFIMVAFAGSLAAAGNYAVQAGKFLQSNNLNGGIELLQKASAYNPFSADYHTNLARIYQVQGQLDEGIVEAQKAVSLSKYSASRHAELAALCFNGKKNSTEAVKAAEKALSLAPFQIRRYEFLARAYFTVGYNELVSGNREAAKQYFEQAANISERIETRMAGLSETEKKLWNVAPLLYATPPVKLSMGAAQYFLGRWDEAEVNLQAVLTDEETKAEAFLWLAVLREKQGRSREAQEYLAQAQELVPELVKKYEGLLRIEILR